MFGHAYEFELPPFPFYALVSVQYYSLASQQRGSRGQHGLCGAEGAFDKDKNLAFTFSKKVARKGLPSTEFAMGYHEEVGVGGSKDVYAVRMWYQLVSRARTTRRDADHNPDARLHHGNTHAVERLAALSQRSSRSLSRQEHDTITEPKLA